MPRLGHSLHKNYFAIFSGANAEYLKARFWHKTISPATIVVAPLEETVSENIFLTSEIFNNFLLQQSLYTTFPLISNAPKISRS